MDFQKPHEDEVVKGHTGAERVRMQQEKVRAHSEDIEDDEPADNLKGSTIRKSTRFLFWAMWRDCGVRGSATSTKNLPGLLDLISNQVALTTSERHKGFQEDQTKHRLNCRYLSHV